MGPSVGAESSFTYEPPHETVLGTSYLCWRGAKGRHHHREDGNQQSSLTEPVLHLGWMCAQGRGRRESDGCARDELRRVQPAMYTLRCVLNHSPSLCYTWVGCVHMGGDGGVCKGCGKDVPAHNNAYVTHSFNVEQHALSNPSFCVETNNSPNLRYISVGCVHIGGDGGVCKETQRTRTFSLHSQSHQTRNVEL